MTLIEKELDKVRNIEGTKNANHDGTKYANPNPESPIPNPEPRLS